MTAPLIHASEDPSEAPLTKGAVCVSKLRSSRRRAHLYLTLAHSSNLEDEPNSNLALAPNPTFPGRKVGRSGKKPYQQQAMFHHTPIDWVIWNELRISFSLIAWILGAS